MEQAPVKGLTRTDTGMPSAIYTGWYLTPQRHDEGMAWSEKRQLSWEMAVQTIRESRSRTKVRPVSGRKTYPLVCKWCGKDFKGTKKTRQFCGPRCSSMHQWSRQEERRKKMVPRTCGGCGKSFETESQGKNTRKTCSPECARLASRRNRGPYKPRR